MGWSQDDLLIVCLDAARVVSVEYVDDDDGGNQVEVDRGTRCAVLPDARGRVRRVVFNDDDGCSKVVDVAETTTVVADSDDYERCCGVIDAFGGPWLTDERASATLLAAHAQLARGRRADEAVLALAESDASPLAAWAFAAVFASVASAREWRRLIEAAAPPAGRRIAMSASARRAVATAARAALAALWAAPRGPDGYAFARLASFCGDDDLARLGPPPRLIQLSREPRQEFAAAPEDKPPKVPSFARSASLAKREERWRRALAACDAALWRCERAAAAATAERRTAGLVARELLLSGDRRLDDDGVPDACLAVLRELEALASRAAPLRAREGRLRRRGKDLRRAAADLQRTFGPDLSAMLDAGGGGGATLSTLARGRIAGEKEDRALNFCAVVQVARQQRRWLVASDENSLYQLDAATGEVVGVLVDGRSRRVARQAVDGFTIEGRAREVEALDASPLACDPGDRVEILPQGSSKWQPATVVERELRDLPGVRRGLTVQCDDKRQLLFLDCDRPFERNGRVSPLDAVRRRIRAPRPRLAILRSPRGLCALPSGEIVICDTHSHALRLLSADSRRITTLAGVLGERGSTDSTPSSSSSSSSSSKKKKKMMNQDDAATQPLFAQPSSVTLVPPDRLVVSDTGNAALRVVALASNEFSTAAASVTTLAGGASSSSVLSAPEPVDTVLRVWNDGSRGGKEVVEHVEKATLVSPGALVASRGFGTRRRLKERTAGVPKNRVEGVVFVDGHSVRHATIPDGVVTTLAGDPKRRGNSDGHCAPPRGNTKRHQVARFDAPAGLAWLDEGTRHRRAHTLLVFDTGNDRICAINEEDAGDFDDRVENALDARAAAVAVARALRLDPPPAPELPEWTAAPSPAQVREDGMVTTVVHPMRQKQIDGPWSEAAVVAPSGATSLSDGCIAFLDGVSRIYGQQAGNKTKSESRIVRLAPPSARLRAARRYDAFGGPFDRAIEDLLESARESDFAATQAASLVEEARTALHNAVIEVLGDAWKRELLSLLEEESKRLDDASYLAAMIRCSPRLKDLSFVCTIAGAVITKNCESVAAALRDRCAVSYCPVLAEDVRALARLAGFLPGGCVDDSAIAALLRNPALEVDVLDVVDLIATMLDRRTKDDVGVWVSPRYAAGPLRDACGALALRVSGARDIVAVVVKRAGHQSLDALCSYFVPMAAAAAAERPESSRRLDALGFILRAALDELCDEDPQRFLHWLTTCAAPDGDCGDVVVVDAAIADAARHAVASLAPGRAFHTLVSQCPPTTRHELVYELAASTLEAPSIAPSRKPPENALDFLSVSNPRVWIALVQWASREDHAKKKSDAWERTVGPIAERAIKAFAAASSDLATGSCTRLLVDACHALNAKQLNSVVDATYLARRVQDTNFVSAELGRFRRVLGCLAEKSDAACHVGDVSSRWNAGDMTVNQALDVVDRGQGLPSGLLEAIEWLDTLCESSIFRRVWPTSMTNAEVDTAIEKTSESWASLFADLDKGTIKVDDDLAAFDFADSQLELLFRTREPFKVLELGATGVIWRTKIRKKLANFRRLDRVRQHLSDLLRLIDDLALLVRSSREEHSSKESASRAALEELANQLSDGWSGLTLADIDAKGTTPIALAAQKVDDRLLDLNPRVVHLIARNPDFCAFISSLPREDSDFASAVEIALGKSELECPPELWLESGRVDEAILSSLSSVRQYIRPVLGDGGVVPRASFEEVLQQFYGDLGGAPSNFCMAFEECLEVALPLVELMSDESEDSTAPNRLLGLFREDWRARWKVGCGDDLSDAVVRLEWEMPRKKTIVHKSANLVELRDFATSVALAGATRAPAVKAAVESFVKQMRWVQELAALRVDLATEGCADAQTLVVPVTTEDGGEDKLAWLVDATRTRLSKWRTALRSARRLHPSLNFLTTAQLNSISRSVEDRSDVVGCLAEVLPGTVFALGALDGVARRLTAAWQPDLEFSRLALLGNELDAALGDVHQQAQTTVTSPFDSGAAYWLTSHDNDIYLTLLSAFGSEFEYYFSEMLARHSATPRLTKHNVLVLDPRLQRHYRSALEHLLLRWALDCCVKFEMYALVLPASESLSPVDWRLLASLLDELAPGAATTNRPPLVIISRTTMSLSPLRSLPCVRSANIPVLTIASLSKFSRLIVDDEDNVRVYASRDAGAGKSFAICSMSAEKNLERKKLGWFQDPLSVADVIDALRRVPHASTDCVLHLDLAANLSELSDSILFSLLFLRELEDGQFAWSWRNGYRIAIETHCDRDSFLKVLPQWDSAHPVDGLVVTRKDLERGFGDSYASHVCLTDAERRRFPKVADEPFSRLRFVCTVLAAARNHPFGRGIDEIDFDDSRTVFDLLEWASRGNQCVTSYRKLWGFVDQLWRSFIVLAMTSAPAAALFVVEDHEGTSFDSPEATKTLRTALVEYVATTVATAIGGGVTPPVRPTRWSAFDVRLTGHSCAALNGVWKRQPFCVDGLCAFQMGDYYLFAQVKCEKVRWIIDKRLSLPDADKNADAGISRSSHQARLSEDPTSSAQWTSSFEWSPASFIQVWVGTRRLEFRGVPSKATSTDGVLCMTQVEPNAPHATIAGRPRYVSLAFDKHDRLHCFYSLERMRWVLASCSDESESVFYQSATTRLDGEWLVPEASRPEPNVRIERYDSSDVAESSTPDDAMSRLERVERWERSNYQCVCINEECPAREENNGLSDDGTRPAISVLGLEPRRTMLSLHPFLRRALEANSVEVGAPFDLSTEIDAHAAMALVTGVHRDQVNARRLLRRYVLTPDNLLKIHNIYTRLRARLPVILVGEAGVGKTFLLNVLCKWVGFRLSVLDCNGGTQSEDILQVVAEAHSFLDTTQNTTYSSLGNEERGGEEGLVSAVVFLDEANSCDHMGLIAELMTNRRINNGKPISPRVHVIAAINPVRRRRAPLADEAETMPGFAYRSDARRDLVDLVYRVNPLAPSLLDFVFSFGSLALHQEESYIRAMVEDRHSSSSISRLEKRSLAACITAAQSLVREVEGDESAVSLRDVRRALDLGVWFAAVCFAKTKPPTKQRKTFDAAFDLYDTAMLGVVHVYFFRLPTESARFSLLATIRGAIRIARGRDSTSSLVGSEVGFGRLARDGVIETLIDTAKRRLCRRFDLGDGIGLNFALAENLYAVTVCLLTRVPVFIVGRPGTSKSLTLSIISSNLNGKNSARPFWRGLPSVTIFSYQCSPLSSSDGIMQQYKSACSYQARSPKTRTVLLLDEVGLAEFSPHKPLKCLHGILTKPPVAIVGISNWSLDAAKMNRAVVLRRPDPTESDIAATGNAIVSISGSATDVGFTTGKAPSPEQPQPPPPPPLLRRTSSSTMKAQWLPRVAAAYHQLYHLQLGGRYFYGMRDFYGLVHLLARAARGTSQLDPRVLDHAVGRSFGGNSAVFEEIRALFFAHVYGSGDAKSTTHMGCMPSTPPSALELVRASLNDINGARHVMLLSRDSTALSILRSSGLVDARAEQTEVLFGSMHVQNVVGSDTSEFETTESVNRVKNAMARGQTLILVECDTIYEALYDLMNQRYVTRTLPGGETVRMSRLALGAKSQLCTVAKTFRLVVVTEEERALKSLDLPLLNRFEKIVLHPAVIAASETRFKLAVDRVITWSNDVATQARLDRAHQCPWFTPSLQSEYCFAAISDVSIASLVLALASYDAGNIDETLESRAKSFLAEISTPVAMSCSTLLLEAYTAGDYFSDRSSLDALLSLHSDAPLLLVMTLSPARHLTTSSECIRIVPVSRLVMNEQAFRRVLAEFLLDGSDGVLVLQLAADVVGPGMVQQICYVVDEALTSYKHDGLKQICVLAHLPALLLHQAGHKWTLTFRSLPWRSLFIDDVRPLSDPSLSSTWISQDLHDALVVDMQAFDRQLEHSLTSAVALTFGLSPQGANDMDDFGSRLAGARTLLRDTRLTELIRRGISRIVRAAPVGLHIDLALRLQAGSTRHSVALALETLTSRAFAAVLTSLDSFGNLSLLLGSHRPHAESKGEETAESLDLCTLWRYFVDDRAVYDQENLTLMAERALRGDELCCAPQRGAYLCHYPFSTRILANFDQARNALSTPDMTSAHGQRTPNAAMCEGLVRSIFTEPVQWCLLRAVDEANLRLLRDYVVFRQLFGVAHDQSHLIVRLNEVACTSLCRSRQLDMTVVNLIVAAWTAEPTLKEVRFLWSVCPGAAENSLEAIIEAVSGQPLEEQELIDVIAHSATKSVVEWCLEETGRLARSTTCSRGEFQTWGRVLVNVQQNVLQTSRQQDEEALGRSLDVDIVVVDEVVASEPELMPSWVQGALTTLRFLICCELDGGEIMERVVAACVAPTINAGGGLFAQMCRLLLAKGKVHVALVCAVVLDEKSCLPDDASFRRARRSVFGHLLRTDGKIGEVAWAWCAPRALPPERQHTPLFRWVLEFLEDQGTYMVRLSEKGAEVSALAARLAEVVSIRRDIARASDLICETARNEEIYEDIHVRLTNLASRLDNTVSRLPSADAKNELLHTTYAFSGVYAVALAIVAMKLRGVDHDCLVEALVEYEREMARSALDKADGFSLCASNVATYGILLQFVRRACDASSAAASSKILASAAKTLSHESEADRTSVVLSAVTRQELRESNFCKNTHLTAWFQQQFINRDISGVALEWIATVSSAWKPASPEKRESALKSTPSRSKRLAKKEKDDELAASKHLPALATHVLAISLRSRSTWLYNLIFSPREFVQRRSHLPTMEAVDVAQVVDVMATQYVQWYTCPRGHLYTVGECGRPMQASRCPCGESIGGESHEPRSGNKPVSDAAAAKTLARPSKIQTRGSAPSTDAPGYFSENASHYSLVSTRKASALHPIGVRFIRLVLHLALSVSPDARAVLSDRATTKISSSSSSRSKGREIDAFTRSAQDFAALCAYFPQTTDVAQQVAVRCHASLDRVAEMLVDRRHSHAFQWVPSISARDEVAERMAQCVAFGENDAGATIKAALASASQASEAKLAQVVLDALGERRYEDHIVSPDQRSPSIVWRPRRSRPDKTTLRSLALLTSGFEAKYPLTFMLLEDDSLVRTVGSNLLAVIDWLDVLRRALLLRRSNNEPLSREEASDLSNGRALQFLKDGDERRAGELVLERYCDVFNAVLPQIDRLFECSANPFIVRDPTTNVRRVDLDAGGDYAARRPMSKDAPVIFSLPAPPSFGEPIDAPCLCVVAIVRHLERLHNSVAGDGEPTSIVIGGGEPRGILERVLVTNAAEEDDPLTNALFECNRSRALENADLDLPRLESELRRRLLRTAKPVQICLPSYNFLGAAHSRGVLARLQAAVPQRRHLSATLRDAIVERCAGRRDRLVALVRLVENVVRVLATLDRAADSSLAEFAIDVFGAEDVDELGLGDASLCDVAGVVLLAEGLLSGTGADALSRVLDSFTCDLSAGLREVLDRAAPQLLDPRAPSRLLEALHDLLVGCLSDVDGRYSPEAALKDFLEYQDADLLDDAHHFQANFPPVLRLKHARATYRRLQALRLEARRLEVE